MKVLWVIRRRQRTMPIVGLRMRVHACACGRAVAPLRVAILLCCVLLQSQHCEVEQLQ